MKIQTQVKHMNTQYRKLKEDAKKLMLRGDIKNYITKLVEVSMMENENREMFRHMKAA